MGKPHKQPNSNNNILKVSYTREEDQFLSYCLYKYGYGTWDLYRFEIENSQRFIFDWKFKMRPSTEIQRRCEFLMGCFKREIEKAKIKRMKEQAMSAQANSKKKGKKKASKGKQKLKIKLRSNHNKIEEKAAPKCNKNNHSHSINNGNKHKKIDYNEEEQIEEAEYVAPPKNSIKERTRQNARNVKQIQNGHKKAVKHSSSDEISKSNGDQEVEYMPEDESYNSGKKAKY